MSRLTIGRSVRILRRERGWTQVGLAAAAGVSQPAISRLERDQLDGMRWGMVRRCVSALDGFLAVEVRRAGTAVSASLDARHAALQNWMAALLGRHGWLVEIEASFNHFGERGRYDVLAMYPTSRVLLAVEVKTSLDDLQDVLGRLDMKARNAPRSARDLRWPASDSVVPGLVVEHGRTAQRRIAAHPALFGRYELRGRAALAWLRRPREPVPRGLLLLVRAPVSREPASERATPRAR